MPVDEERAKLAQAYHECVLSHWKLCAAGLAIGMPMSMKTKSHLYWAIGGISGTALDWIQSMQDCKSHADKLRAYEANVQQKS